jgi:hypothetical protein
MAAKKQTLANTFLNVILRAGTYTGSTTITCGLFTIAPTATTAGTEVVGVGYTRMPVKFRAAVAGSTSNELAVTFAAAQQPWGNVMAAVLFDSNGTQLYYGNLGVPKTVGIGDQITFAPGSLSVSES